MATFASKNVHLTINSDDMSSYVQSFSFPISADAVEETAMGDDSREYVVGLKNASFTVGFKHDFAVDTMDTEIWDIYDGAVSVTFVFRPDTGAVSTSNAQYSGSCILTEYPVHDGAVGDLATTTCTFQITGDVSRATSS